MGGTLAFAWESPTWGGGIAFHQPDAQGTTLARVYLVTVRQFADVLEQEMRRDPGADHDLAAVVGGRRHAVGPGRYETLHLAGEVDGRPVVTFSSPDVEALGLRAPAPAYVATIARGLRQAHGLAEEQILDYLLGCPGVTGALSRSDLAAALS